MLILYIFEMLHINIYICKYLQKLVTHYLHSNQLQNKTANARNRQKIKGSLLQVYYKYKGISKYHLQSLRLIRVMCLYKRKLFHIKKEREKLYHPRSQNQKVVYTEFKARSTQSQTFTLAKKIILTYNVFICLWTEWKYLLSTNCAPYFRDVTANYHQSSCILNPSHIRYNKDNATERGRIRTRGS